MMEVEKVFIKLYFWNWTRLQQINCGRTRIDDIDVEKGIKATSWTEAGGQPKFEGDGEMPT